MVGIYKITNQVNGKVYVGQSNDIYIRRCCHKSELRKNRHHNIHLQGAWNKYGEENFIFETIEECNEDELDKREIYWINYYKSNDENYGYNLTIGGSGIRGYTCSEDLKDKMSKSKNPPKIVQLDFNGNLIKVWRSATHAQRTLNNIRARSILQCARHICYQAIGYIWFFEEEYNNIKDTFNIHDYLFSHRRYFDIPICQYSLYGTLIKIWSQKELKTEYQGTKFRVIIKVCDHEKNTYDGYIWKYEYDYNFNLNSEYLLHCRKASGLYDVIQYDKDMNLIKEWTREELSKTTYNILSINKCCKGKLQCPTYKGYYWKYKYD